MSADDNPPWLEVWPRGLPHEISVPRVGLCHYLDVAAARYPDRAAFLFYGRALDYRDFRRQVDALAAHLQRQAGLQPGDRVLLMSQNCPQFAVAFHAILRAGGVVVPVNAMSKAGELNHYLADSGATVAIAAQELLPALAPALANERIRHGVVICYADALPPGPAPSAAFTAADGSASPGATDGIPGDPVDRPGARPDDPDQRRGVAGDRVVGLDLPSWVAAPPRDPGDPRLVRWTDALADGSSLVAVAEEPDGLCLLPYTSGTTGHPKGCRHTHRTLLAATLSATLWRHLHPEAIVLGVAPLFHLLGLQNCLLMPISQGATVVLLPRWNAADAGRLIERHRISVWAAPPAMLIDFFADPDVASRDLSSLAMLNGGGAAMPEAVAALLKDRFGITYIEGYGMTETASFLHCNPLERSKRQCLGIPAFGVDSRVVDPDTLADLPPGETGELVTSGPQLMLGYWKDEAANAAAFFERDGRRYFRTGDLACMDAEGYFFMRDRLKRMINVSGYKVWPAEVESLLYEHPAVQEACVVAAPDARKGETVRAVIVPRAGIDLDETALIDWCRDRMAVYKVPRQVELRESLPRSATGKVMWRELQAEARLSPVPDPGAPGSRDPRS